MLRCIVADESLVLNRTEDSPRSRKPYEALQSTQKWKRRKEAREAVDEVLDRIGCPLEAIHSPPRPSPADLIHLSTAVREQIRSVPTLRIPSEQTMIKCKRRLAMTHATATGTFAGGAYITDPLAYVSVLCAQSPMIAVGGDAGGGRCVLGVTYSPAGKPLLHYWCMREETAGWSCRIVVLKV